MIKLNYLILDLNFNPQILQTKLKMSLPDDIAPALTDGVVLCHLANHIKPRSVGSIHVPSPAVVSLIGVEIEKLSINLDLFLAKTNYGPMSKKC